MRARIILVSLLVLLASRDAASEPATSPPAPVETKIQTPAERKLCMPDLLRCLTLPPGRFVDEDTWLRIDAETRRLQEAETRLTAENRSMRETVSGWQPGWKLIMSTLVIGLIGGSAAYHYARD